MISRAERCRVCAAFRWRVRHCRAAQKCQFWRLYFVCCLLLHQYHVAAAPLAVAGPRAAGFDRVPTAREASAAASGAPGRVRRHWLPVRFASRSLRASGMSALPKPMRT